MEKITMQIKHFLIFIFTSFVSVIYAQNDVEFTANVSKNRLGLNERLRVEFMMNKDGDNFTPPNFEGFRVIMGPSQSVSRSWVNGVSSFSKSYVYMLEPTAKGEFLIKQASIEYKGKTYKTTPIQITVTNVVENPSIEKSTNDIAKDNLFLIAEVSNENPYLNEPVSVVYRLYVGREVGISDLRQLQTPKYPDFWNQELQLQRYEAEDCTYQGKPYRCIVVKRVVLYPQKSAKITLESLALDITLVVPTGRRDFFGRPETTQINRRVTAGNRTLDIKPLPEADKPDNFSGAVGDFNFTVSTSKEIVKATESLQAKVEISGTGNFNLFDVPKLTFPPALEVYDPEQTDAISTSFSGMKGSLTQSYTVIPQYKGKYPVPSVSFSYFNPKTKKYVTLNSDQLLINVTEGPVSSGQNYDSVAKKTVEMQGNQFRFLQLNPDLKPMNQPVFFGSFSYYLWLFLPLLIIPIVLVFWKYKQAQAGDVEGNRIRQANRLARKYLSEAKRKLNDQNTFYEAMERALHNYLKAKLKIETSELSKDKITELLQQKSVHNELIYRFITLLGNCEMARYAKHTATAMENDYQSAVTIISDLDKQIKS